jgi:hypothetical protein
MQLRATKTIGKKTKMEKTRKIKVILTILLATIITFASVSISYSKYIVTKITKNSYDDRFPQINDNGYIVWEGYDGSDWEIFLYDGTNITQLTDNSYDDNEPKINNNGYVVWSGQPTGTDTEIFLYDGTSITQITDDSYYDDRLYQINNNGYVAWSRLDGYNYEIFLYDGTSITQITHKSIGHDAVWPQINNDGYIVWQGYDGHDYEIFLASPRITLLLPNGGEIIPSGSTYTIQWGAPSQATKFKLKYSVDNGTTWQLITPDFVTGTRHDWKVPTPTNNKKKCLVKVIGFDSKGKKVGADKSDTAFTIEVVKLTSPDGGEILTSGEQFQYITWATYGTKNPPVASVVLFYTLNGGTTWKRIDTLPDNPGSYEWTVPPLGVTKNYCKVKVVLKDVSGISVGKDVSDSSFTIQPAP